MVITVCLSRPSGSWEQKFRIRSHSPEIRLCDSSWRAPLNENEKLSNLAARFCIEHSSRSPLASWARALGVPKEVTDLLGYWAVGIEAAEVYIRKYRGLMARVQDTVAAFMKAAFSAEVKDDAFPDLFGALAAMTELKEHMTSKIEMDNSVCGMTARTSRCHGQDPNPVKQPRSS